MTHRATGSFWSHYRRLPPEGRDLADKAFVLLRTNPRHPSLHLKKTGELWSVRISLNWRALALEDEGGLNWFWIGEHREYHRLTK